MEKKQYKRALCALLAACLTVSLALPGIAPVRAQEVTAVSNIWSDDFENAEVTGANYSSDLWQKETAKIYAATIVEEEGNKVLSFKVNGDVSTATDETLVYKTNYFVTDNSAVVISFDLKISGENYFQINVHPNDSDASFINLLVLKTGEIQVKRGTSWVNCEPATSLENGKWHNLQIAVFQNEGTDNDSWKLYVDGELKTTETGFVNTTNNKSAGAVTFYIGNNWGTPLEGTYVDNMAAYEYVPATSVRFGETAYSVNAGKTLQMAATVAPANASIVTGVTYASDNTAVATVDDNGLVTAVAPGTANITATVQQLGAEPVTCSAAVTVNWSDDFDSAAVTAEGEKYDSNLWQTKTLGAYNVKVVADTEKEGNQILAITGDGNTAADNKSLVYKSAYFNSNSGAMVVSMDLKITQGDLIEISFHPQGSDASLVRLMTTSAGGLNYYNSGWESCGDVTVADGNWHNLQLVMIQNEGTENDSWKLYQDGEEKFSQAGFISTTTSNANPGAVKFYILNDANRVTGTYVDNMVAYAYVPEESYAITGTSMTLGSNLDMNFFIQQPADAGTGYSVKMVKTDASGNTVTQTVDQSEWVYSDYYGKYYATFTGVAAKNMGDQVAVTVCDSEGNAVSETYTDSVKEYATRCMALDTTSEKLKAVCEDMLLYGAAAQVKFGYDTNDLVSSGLNKTIATPSVTNDFARDDAWVGSTLVLESDILMKAFFKADAVTGGTWTVTYTDHYGNSETLTGNAFGQDEGSEYLYVPITGLSIADFNTVVTVTITVGDQTITGTDSMASFVARSATDQDIYKAIIQFGQSAYDYFHSGS